MPRRVSLREDFADAKRSFGGPVLPRVPYEQRSWLRLRTEAVFHSEVGQGARAGVEDLVDRLRGRRDPDVPPRRLQLLIGGSDYRGTAREYQRLFTEIGRLQPTDDVLDVGSGSGRAAYALKGWLTGRYEGFDIAADAVAWCQENITPGYPNFRFQVADLRSGRYNPTGRYEATEYRFPYDDASFDFAFLTSVFTHLQKPAVDNYISELARVLRPGGRCMATYLLINDETRRLLGGNGQFGFDQGDQLVVDEEVPERAVAFREEAVREMHERNGLPIESIHYGSWCGRERYESVQDITLSVRG